MSLTIRITEKHGDTERTIVIGEPPKPVIVHMQPIALGDFLSRDIGKEAGAVESAKVKLDAKYQPLPANTTDASWVYTHDRSTDLVWARAESADEMNFEKAQAFCAKFGDGFRMPTIRERLSLVDYDRHEPAIDTTFFDSQKSGWSWTSTDAAWSKDAKTGTASAAWLVYLHSGLADTLGRSYNAFVRAVRSGVPSSQ